VCVCERERERARERETERVSARLHRYFPYARTPSVPRAHGVRDIDMDIDMDIDLDIDMDTNMDIKQKEQTLK